MSENDVLFGYRLRVLDYAQRTSVSEACRPCSGSTAPVRCSPDNDRILTGLFQTVKIVVGVLDAI